MPRSVFGNLFAAGFSGSARTKRGPVLHRLFAFHLPGLSGEALNLLRRGPGVGNINISRRTKGIPDRPVSIGDSFVTALAVGAAGAVSVKFSSHLLYCVPLTAHIQGNGRIQP